MPTAAPTEVDPAMVIDWMADPDAVTILDVRSPAAQLAARRDRKVVLVCQSGVRADQARQRPARTGMDNLHVLKAPLPGYAAAGGQVVNGRPRWGLERQVRLLAGGLVLAGVVASRWTPKAALLAGGIGTGLTASALTDTCTMGRLLSALPYNRGTEADAQQLLDQLPTAAEPITRP